MAHIVCVLGEGDEPLLVSLGGCIVPYAQKMLVVREVVAIEVKV